MTTWTCDNCGDVIPPKTGWRVTRSGQNGYLFVLRAALTRHATEEAEFHICSTKCSGRWLELMTNPDAKNSSEVVFRFNKHQYVRESQCRSGCSECGLPEVNEIHTEDTSAETQQQQDLRSRQNNPMDELFNA